MHCIDNIDNIEQLQTKNQILYTIQDTVLYLITTIITGAYLAKLTGALGFSDSLTATISSCVALGYIFQLLAIPLFRKGRVKSKITALYTFSTILFVLLYAVPFIDISPKLRTLIFIAFFLVGNFILNMVFPPKTNMYMSFVPDLQRGRFTAIKEGVSLVCGIVFQFIMGRVIDSYEISGNINDAFITCALTIFVLTGIHTLSLASTYELEPQEKNRTPLIKDLKEMLTSKKTICIILLGGFWSMCYNMSISFYGTYQVKELGFSMSFVTLLSVITAASRIPASIFLGRFADRHSFAKMLIICYSLISAGFLAMVFARPSNGHILYPIYSLFSAMAFGGINSAEVNIVYDYIEPQKRMNVIAVKQTLYGLCGFGMTLLVTPLVNHIQKSGNMFFGMNLYAQQVLSAMSFVMIILLIMYVNIFILKNKTNKK